MVCGMGGSAIGGDLAAVAFGSRLSRPLDTVRSYELPSSMLPDRAVLCSSYSGDTEETIACYEAAEALGARRIVATTGGELAAAARRDGVPVIGLPAGLQPRAAVGYLFTVAAEVAALVGAAPGIRTEIDSSAAHLREASDSLAELAAGLAERLEGSIPVIYGADLTVPGRRSLEDPDQRERQAARVRGRAARGRSQRDRRLGGRGRGGSPQRRLPRGPGSAPARQAALRADREAGRGRRRGRRPRGDRGREPHRAPAVGGDARRPPVPPSRRSPGSRSLPGRGDRAPQGRARPLGVVRGGRSASLGAWTARRRSRRTS